MRCPRCGENNTQVVGDHYICNNESCHNPNGTRTQFSRIEDSEFMFPYNQIFINRGKYQFARYPYLKIKDIK